MLNPNKRRLNELTRHIILIKSKEEAKEHEALIKRRFPAVLIPQLVQQPPPQPVKPQPAAIEVKEELFDIGKITGLAFDKNIDLIECSGPGLPLRVKKESYDFNTDISLTKEEINEIIKKFSDESKTPISPIFRADVKNLSMTALVSEAGSRFLIVRLKK